MSYASWSLLGRPCCIGRRRHWVECWKHHTSVWCSLPQIRPWSGRRPCPPRQSHRRCTPHDCCSENRTNGCHCFDWHSSHSGDCYCPGGFACRCPHLRRRKEKEVQRSIATSCGRGCVSWTVRS